MKVKLHQLNIFPKRKIDNLYFLVFCFFLTPACFSQNSLDLNKEKVIGTGNLYYFIKSVTIIIDHRDSVKIPVNTRLFMKSNQKNQLMSIPINDTLEIGAEIIGKIKRRKIFKKSLCFHETNYYRIKGGSWTYIEWGGHCDHLFNPKVKEYKVRILGIQTNPVMIGNKNVRIYFELDQGYINK